MKTTTAFFDILKERRNPPLDQKKLYITADFNLGLEDGNIVLFQAGAESKKLMVELLTFEDDNRKTFRLTPENAELFHLKDDTPYYLVFDEDSKVLKVTPSRGMRATRFTALVLENKQEQPNNHIIFGPSAGSNQFYGMPQAVVSGKKNFLFRAGIHIRPIKGELYHKCTGILRQSMIFSPEALQFYGLEKNEVYKFEYDPFRNILHVISKVQVGEEKTTAVKIKCLSRKNTPCSTVSNRSLFLGQKTLRKLNIHCLPSDPITLFKVGSKSKKMLLTETKINSNSILLTNKALAYFNLIPNERYILRWDPKRLVLKVLRKLC